MYTKHSQVTSILFLLVISFSVFLCTACTPSVIVKIKPDASGSALFNAEMSTTADTLARRFSGSSDNGNAHPIFDKDKIIISLANAGIKADSVTFPSRTAIALNLSFLKLDGLLDQAVILKKESKKISITLSAESINAAMDLMPPDTRDYLDLLMAPIFTGETLTSAEYEEVVGAAYGKTLKEELKKSFFTLTIHCPTTIQSAKITSPGNATKTDTTAVFTIPLSALLALENPLTATAEWK